MSIRDLFVKEGIPHSKIEGMRWHLPADVFDYMWNLFSPQQQFKWNFNEIMSIARQKGFDKSNMKEYGHPIGDNMVISHISYGAITYGIIDESGFYEYYHLREYAHTIQAHENAEKMLMLLKNI